MSSINGTTNVNCQVYIRLSLIAKYTTVLMHCQCIYGTSALSSKFGTSALSSINGTNTLSSIYGTSALSSINGTNTLVKYIRY